MRVHRKSLALMGVLIVLTVLYINVPIHPMSAGLAETKDSIKVPRSSIKDVIKLSWHSQSPQQLMQRTSWVDQGHFLPLNVSCHLLAGRPTTQQKFLTVGMASVRRKKGSYLLSSLRSLFSHSSPEERSSMVVVLLLADFDAQWREATVGEIRTEFAPELEQGQLLVIHVPQQYYPPLTGLKRNYNDSADRVSFRSKQNVDYSFLMHCSVGSGSFYLQLEDDVASAQGFLSTIRRRVQEQEAKSVTWATLEFSNLGYIGKLYRSVHLPLLARFLFLFYQEMPCDWLLAHFRLLLTQKEAILLRPSLFQHMGTFSSFRGTVNKLRDKDFEEDVYSNPPADVYSDMSVYKDHVPPLAWASGTGFFWGRAPQAGNHLTVVFREPALVTGVTVETGSEGKDLLGSAVVELGSDPVATETGEKTCRRFSTLGKMGTGMFKTQEVEKKNASLASCLRIKVTTNQSDWLIVRKIRIKTQTRPHVTTRP